MTRSARDVLDLVRTRPGHLAGGRLVCIDGPAGSGKTTLAADLLGLAPDAGVVHTDELLEGWCGLPRLPATLDRVLRPLATGQETQWTRWDWLSSAWAESHPLSPGGLLVLEGVGAGSLEVADLCTVLVWVEASAELRWARGMARDGEAMAGHWRQWQLDEAVHHEQHRTRQRADLTIDTDAAATP